MELDVKRSSSNDFFVGVLSEEEKEKNQVKAGKNLSKVMTFLETCIGLIHEGYFIAQIAP